MNSHFLKTLLFSKNPDYSFAVITPHINEIDLKTLPYLNQWCSLYFGSKLIAELNTMSFNLLKFHIENTK